MGESRTELLAWLNDLLQLNYTKIEQCGTGAAYCQIMDSIFGDVPMTRVKMNAKHEYEFIANFKILQNVFRTHKVDKPILVEKLVKCKMQDNLEFLQWIKRFWDTNYGGQGYDAVARRRGAPTDTPATIAPLAPSSSRGSAGSLHAGAARVAGGRTPVGPRAGSRAGSTQPNELVQNLQGQLREMSAHLEGLEKERDFYFAKLRDIEILVQQQLETLEQEGKDDPLLRDIQKILYSTEEGFEVPEPGTVDEEETF
ncbi:microtubule binding protein [Laetiporus sulphureus 93-53]|uniref:Microtubule binding protein n=1 Tax=Laetiporus sulphureus 93-53 TaxID=1314785 RepID=A0A165HVF2_9APHY|nr:microtubule binding protein [Laetiporus sulphureus 93-53]KZT12240.1 microtubule binding protein [Laetiporus sulphureus 93-53]